MIIGGGGVASSSSSSSTPSSLFPAIGAAATFSPVSPIIPKSDESENEGHFPLDSSNSSSSSSAPPSKRKPPIRQTPEERQATRFASYCKNAYIDDSEAAYVRYKSDGYVHCTFCNVNVKVVSGTVSQSGNLKVHANTAQHKGFAKAEAAVDSAARHHLAFGEQPTAESTLRSDKLRALMKASLLSEGVAPNAWGRLFDGDIAKSVNILREANPLFKVGASPTKNSSDLEIAFGLVLNEVKRLLILKPGMNASIVTDGGGRLHGMRGKCFVIMLESSELEKTLFLHCAMPSATDDDGNALAYDAVRAAEDVRKVLVDFGFPESQLTFMTGDNVNFNSALANALNLAWQKCCAHSAALQAKLASRLPFFREIVGAGGIIWAGGSTRRASRLAALGTNPNKLYMHENRFASAVMVALYFFLHFLPLRTFFTTDTTIFPPKKTSTVAPASSSSSNSTSAVSAGSQSSAGASSSGSSASSSSAPSLSLDDDDEESDEEEDESSSFKSKARPGTPGDERRATKIKKALELHGGLYAPVLLCIIDQLFGRIPIIVKNASTTGRHLNSDFLEEVQLYHALLVVCRDDPKSVFDSAVVAASVRLEEVITLAQALKLSSAKFFFSCKKHEKKESKNLIEIISALVAQGLTLYENHFVPAMENLRRRFLYQVNRKTPPPSLSEILTLAQEAKLAPNSYVGCAPEYWTKWKAEWSIYCKNWASIPLREMYDVLDKDGEMVCSSSYYRGKESQEMGAWTALPLVARFWLESEPGAICAERAIALMRQFDLANRQSMLNSTFQREMFIRCNKWVVDYLLRQCLDAHEAHVQEAITAFKAELAAADDDDTAIEGKGGE